MSIQHTCSIIHILVAMAKNSVEKLDDTDILNLIKAFCMQNCSDNELYKDISVTSCYSLCPSQWPILQFELH